VADRRCAAEPPPEAFLAGEPWVFAYGSLLWNPGFPYAEACRAQVYGYHRALCVWSWIYRGTPSVPGLVLGLDRGGSCLGLAYRVPEAERRRVAEYLFGRELVSRVYRPVCPLARLADGRRVRVLAFAVDRAHVQYAGRLAPEEAAGIVARARGRKGPNWDYVRNTVLGLERLGAPHGLLHEVHAHLEG